MSSDRPTIPEGLEPPVPPVSHEFSDYLVRHHLGPMRASLELMRQTHREFGERLDATERSLNAIARATAHQDDYVHDVMSRIEQNLEFLVGVARQSGVGVVLKSIRPEAAGEKG